MQTFIREMNESDVTWVNLKVLAKLEPFQKLNTRRTHFQLQTSAIPYVPEFITRWWVGSNRESDYVRLKELYAAANTIIQDDNHRERMVEHLKDSCNGLVALQKTYENDATTKAKIDWLIDSVRKSINDNTIDIDDVFD
jgi:hypothetical protein